MNTLNDETTIVSKEEIITKPTKQGFTGFTKDQDLEDYISDLYEAKHKKFKALINQLAYKGYSKKGAFVQKECHDIEDLVQMYQIRIWNCCRKYWDQPTKLDTLIRAGFTTLSIDINNARRKTEVNVNFGEDELKAIQDKDEQEFLADKMVRDSGYEKQTGYRTAQLCYQFSDLATEDHSFDMSCETLGDLTGNFKCGTKTEKGSYRDQDQYRQSLISDEEYNEFLDYRAAYKDSCGSSLIGETELQFLGFLLNMPEGVRWSQTKAAGHLKISSVKLKKAKDNIIKALDIYRAEIA